MYKQKNGLLPEIFNDYFQTRNKIHNINTRQANKIDVVKSRTNIGYNRVQSTGAKLFNMLPTDISESSSIAIFKRKVKNNLLSLYY